MQVTGLRKPLEPTEAFELSDGRFVCSTHLRTVCDKCYMDFSSTDQILNNDSEEYEEDESDGDEMLTEEEMNAFKERMIAKKGAATTHVFFQPWRLSTD